MHNAALAYVAAHVPRTVTSVLEFGSRNINGSPRTVVPPDVVYVGVDIRDGIDVDIVADAAAVRVDSGPFDAVVCAEVFEHIDDQHCADIIRNAFDHLYSGGTFVATMAGPGRQPHSAADGGALRDGEFYRNVGRDLLAAWLEGAGFDEYTIDVKADDIRCTAVRT